MRHILFIAVLLVTRPAMAWGLPAVEQATIGVVRNTAGQVAVTRGDRILPAVVGTKLLAGDTLSTGPDGSMGVILRDNSSLSLGPGSRLVIKEFFFDPAQGQIGLLARITRGTMAYISGLIGQLAPE